MIKLSSGKSPKLSLIVFYVFCLIIAIQPIALTAPNYISVHPGVFFKPSSSHGPIHFDSEVRSTQIRFLDSYVYFSNFEFENGDYVWPVLGFQCSDNSNVTITKADRTLVQYTVENLTASSTSQKIYFPSEWDKPTSVSGAWNWDYSSRTLTVTTLPSSPRTINIKFSDYIEEVNVINSRILKAVNLFVIVPIVLGAALLYGSMEGSIDASTTLKVLFMIIIQAILFFAIMEGTN